MTKKYRSPLTFREQMHWLGWSYLQAWLWTTLRHLCAQPARLLLVTAITAGVVWRASASLALILALPLFMAGLPDTRLTDRRTLRVMGLMTLSAWIVVTLLNAGTHTLMPWLSPLWAHTPHPSLDSLTTRAVTIVALWMPVGALPLLPLFILPDLCAGISLQTSFQRGMRFFKTGSCAAHPLCPNSPASIQQRYAILLLTTWMAMFMVIALLLAVLRVPGIGEILLVDWLLILAAPTLFTVIREDLQGINQRETAASELDGREHSKV